MTDVADREGRRWWRLVRSAVGLVFLVIGLGVAVAALLGLLVLAVGAALDQAVG